MQKRTSSAASRPFTRKNTVFPACSAGFTLIELMVSLVLLAVSAALALPSYRDMIEKRQLTHGAEQIMAFVNSAQLQSSRRNLPVTISWLRTTDDEWCIGTTVGETACDCAETDPNESNFCAVDGVASVLSNLNTGSHELLKSIAGDSDYTFDPVRGILDGFTDPLIIQMSSNSETYVLNLVMNMSGQASLCSKDSDHSMPGYKVCAAVEAEEI